MTTDKIRRTIRMALMAGSVSNEPGKLIFYRNDAWPGSISEQMAERVSDALSQQLTETENLRTENTKLRAELVAIRLGARDPRTENFANEFLDALTRGRK